MKKLLRFIRKTAINITDNSVGKSIPIFLHEINVPDIIKQKKDK